MIKKSKVYRILEKISFSVKVPKEWHKFKMNFEYACYLLCVESYHLDGEPHKNESAGSLRLSVREDVYNKYFESLIKKYGTRVAAVNAVLQFLSKNPHLTAHKISL